MTERDRFSPHYIGLTGDVPDESFLIAKSGKYQRNMTGITPETEFYVQLNPNNKSNSDRLIVTLNSNILGFVPAKNVDVVSEHINEPLQIISIQTICGITGIRVISKSLNTQTV
jgi:hypothetical protein